MYTMHNFRVGSRNNQMLLGYKKVHRSTYFSGTDATYPMYSEASAPLHFYRLILQITLLHDVCLRIHRDDFTNCSELAQIIV